GTPIQGGVNSANVGLFCANLDAAGGPGTGAVLRINAIGVDPAVMNVSFSVNWDDGSPQPILPAAQIAANEWQLITPPHYFPTTGPDVKCEYVPRVSLYVNTVLCNPNFGQPPTFTRWNVDNENTGELILTETATN